MRSWPRCDLGGGYTVPAIFDSVDNVQKIQGPCPNFVEIGNSWIENNIKILPMVDFRATKVIPIKYLILL